MTTADPANDSRAIKPTLCLVLRPLCCDGRRREVGELVELPFHVAVDCEHVGKAKIHRLKN